MINNVKVSEVISALEQVKDMHGDKEICIMRIIVGEEVHELFIEFMDYTTHTIEIKTDECESCFNYNVGDGVDDISKCHGCEYYKKD